MSNQNGVDLPSALTEALNCVPSTARVVVEGGHYGIDVADIGFGRLPGVIIKYMPDTSILLRLCREEPPLPFELMRIPLKDEKSLVWAVVCLPEGESLDLSRIGSLANAYRLEYRPSPTQIQSLHNALEVGHQLSRKGVYVETAILVGDRHLPQPIRGDLSWLVPTSYRELLESYGISENMRLYSEAACRNKGQDRVLDPWTSLIRRGEDWPAIYQKYGFSIIRNAINQSYYLTSDYIVDELMEFPFVVALTKEKRAPTCGLILAGKFYSMFQSGITHFISNYDMADDPMIRRKNIDGMLISSYLIDNFDFEAMFWTSRTIGGRQGPPVVECFSSSEFRRPGRFGSLDDLLESTRRENNFPGFDFVERLCSDSCFPTRNKS